MTEVNVVASGRAGADGANKHAGATEVDAVASGRAGADGADKKRAGATEVDTVASDCAGEGDACESDASDSLKTVGEGQNGLPPLCPGERKRAGGDES